MARRGRLVLLAAAVVLARAMLPDTLAFTGTRSPLPRAANMRHTSQSRVGMRASCKVFVGNLDGRVGDEAFEEHMRQAGEIVEARIRTSTKGKGYFGFVEYKTPEDAE
eukprot:CAMPEP_0178415788 /NCGR_PEP_ID=MMETSP0689_2-20121128/23731_1 /TAXON_ID=160604 /ORGANISM="Amphidinium massartii, Strain CS-259" /LENGTH=107 /DNA_ID=CAMNT_0020037117 /DNA_START=12 /DNA_END=332 /DNA_ORIENTATION=+